MIPSTNYRLSRWKCPVTAILCIWVIGICLVWWSMTTYSFKIDGEAQALDAWPSAAHLTIAEDRPTVLLFLHPRCPCSVASLTELERALSEIPTAQQPRLFVLATVPAEHDAEWIDSNNIQRSRQLPNVEVVLDVGGQESHKFGVASSGHVMAFAPTGKLLFSGGVTQSRGHQGNNAGRAALVQILAGNEVPIATDIPVFGCRLCLPEPSSPSHTDPTSPAKFLQASFP